MTEPAAKKPAKRRVLTCLLVSLSAGLILSVLFVLSVAGFLRSKGVGVPDEEAVALEAKYGDAAEALIKQLEDETSRIREAGAAARAALPPDAIISADWDTQVELEKAWTAREQETIRCLCRRVSYLRSEALKELRESFGEARGKDQLTDLEERFDPNIHSEEEVLRSFDDYALEFSLLDQMEAAIDYGIWPMSVENPRVVCWSHDPFTLARWLLCHRAEVLVERGDTAGAMAVCVTLCKLHGLMLRDPACDLYQFDPPLAAVVNTLRPLAKDDGAGDDLLSCLGECVEVLPPREEYLKRLRLEAAVVVRRNTEGQLLSGYVASGGKQRLYRAMDQVESLIVLLENPSAESGATYGALKSRWEPTVSYDTNGDDVKMTDLAKWYVAGLQADTQSYWDTAGLGSAYETVAYMLTLEAILKTALALGEYKQDNGAYPDSLDALVPDRLDAVPVSPLSGKPFGFELVGGGYRLIYPAADDDNEDDPAVVWETPR